MEGSKQLEAMHWLLPLLLLLLLADRVEEQRKHVLQQGAHLILRDATDQALRRQLRLLLLQLAIQDGVHAVLETADILEIVLGQRADVVIDGCGHKGVRLIRWGTEKGHRIVHDPCCACPRAELKLRASALELDCDTLLACVVTRLPLATRI